MGIHEIILAITQWPLEAREKPGDLSYTISSTVLQAPWACKSKFYCFNHPVSNALPQEPL